MPELKPIKISKHYGEWFKIRDNPKCNWGNWDKFTVRGSYSYGRTDVYMRGQEARYYAQTLMGLEGKNMWRGYSKDTGEPPGNEAGEAAAEGIRLWFRVYFSYKDAGVGYIEFTRTGEGESAPAFCWWFGNPTLGEDGNPHPCVIMQVSQFEIANWLERIGWYRGGES